MHWKILHPAHLAAGISAPQKTRAKVAMLRCVRGNTKIQIPKVFGFEVSNHNEIGDEWILMGFMEGIPAHRSWQTMSMEQKVELTKRITIF